MLSRSSATNQQTLRGSQFLVVSVVVACHVQVLHKLCNGPYQLVVVIHASGHMLSNRARIRGAWCAGGWDNELAHGKALFVKEKPSFAFNVVLDR